MRKLITIALVAAGALVTAACSGGGNDATANAADPSADAGNPTGGEGTSGNDVTAVDSDGATGNGYDPSAVPPDAANAIDPIGNAADPSDNLVAPSGNAS